MSHVYAIALIAATVLTACKPDGVGTNGLCPADLPDECNALHGNDAGFEPECVDFQTDPNNCGACGAQCGVVVGVSATGACAAGACVPPT